MTSEPAKVPEHALSILVGAGLLRRDDDGERQRYSIVSDGVAEAVALANQSWRGKNWPEAKRLRKLQERAERWADGNQANLLLRREEIRGAQKLISMAKVSGVGFSDGLNVFVTASTDIEVSRKLDRGKQTAVVLATIAIISVLIPTSNHIKWWVFSGAIFSCGATLGLLAMHDYSSFPSVGFRFLAILVAVTVALCLWLWSLVYSWPMWITVPVGFFLAYFACCGLYGAFTDAENRHR